MARMKFMNIEIDNLTMDEAVDAIDALVQKRKFSYVVTPNVDHIVKLESDVEFQSVYKNANLILTDGKPLLWISKWYGTPIKAKVSGSDLFPRICELAARKDYRLFFLGAAEGVAEKAADKLRGYYANLNIVGTYSPTRGFEKDETKVEQVIQIVRNAYPDILILALGSPKQEKFIFEHLDKLQVPLSVGLGASIDFVAGNVKRAPKWMSEHGLEWLYRLMQDPQRMFRRYIVDDMQILALAIKYRPRREKGRIKA